MGCQNQVHTCGTSHLCKSANAVLYLRGSRHHKVRQLVYCDYYPAHLLLGNGQTVNLESRLNKLAILVFDRRIVLDIFKVFLDKGVVRVNLLTIKLGENFISLEHFIYRPAECRGGFFSVGDNRDKQVRNSLVL